SSASRPGRGPGSRVEPRSPPARRRWAGSLPFRRGGARMPAEGTPESFPRSSVRTRPSLGAPDRAQILEERPELFVPAKRARVDPAPQPADGLPVPEPSAPPQGVVFVEQDDELLGAIEGHVFAEPAREAAVLADDRAGVHVVEEVVRRGG